jgi:hypothetical protein
MVKYASSQKDKGNIGLRTNTTPLRPVSQTTHVTTPFPKQVTGVRILMYLLRGHDSISNRIFFVINQVNVYV